MGKRKLPEELPTKKKKQRREAGDLKSGYLNDPYSPCRPYKITVAVAGTILDNAVGLQQKTFLAGQISRAISIFNIDEIVVFNDKPVDSDGCSLLILILRYLESPPYLKRALFQMTSSLQFAGALPPLCLPYHFGKNDISKYRDGFVASPGKIEVGIANKVICDNVELPEGVRVTVKIQNPEVKNRELKGKIVAPWEAANVTGLYWGYSVTQVKSLHLLLTSSKYDCIIGTSDTGSQVSGLKWVNEGKPWQNLLIIFGGVDGLEAADECMDDCSKSTFLDHFDHYINVRPSQGTKTIRTEEAIPLTLAALEGPLRQTARNVENWPTLSQ